MKQQGMSRETAGRVPSPSKQRGTEQAGFSLPRPGLFDEFWDLQALFLLVMVWVSRWLLEECGHTSATSCFVVYASD